MSFDKVTYTDKVTKIMAKNLNDIQNELGNLSERIDGMSEGLSDTIQSWLDAHPEVVAASPKVPSSAFPIIDNGNAININPVGTLTCTKIGSSYLFNGDRGNNDVYLNIIDGSFSLASAGSYYTDPFRKATALSGSKLIVSLKGSAVFTDALSGGRVALFALEEVDNASTVVAGQFSARGVSTEVFDTSWEIPLDSVIGKNIRLLLYIRANYVNFELNVKVDTCNQYDYVSPEMFGAKGNGTADDTIAWQKAVDSGKNVVALSSKYLCSQINITRNISIDCNNAEFTCSSPILFNAAGEEKATLTGQTDYSANLSDYQIADEAHADYSGFAVLQGTNNFDTSRSYYHGGFACTFSNGKIDCAYPIDVTNNQNGITIKIVDPITISIKNLGNVVRSGSGATETSAIKITYGLNCIVENVNASSLMGTHAIAFWSCLNCVCRNSKIAKTYGTTGSDSYIVAFLDSSFCKVKDSYLYNQYWHCISLGGNYLCYKNSVDNCILLNDSGRAYSDHENAVGTMLLNSVIASAAVAGQVIIDNVRIVSNKDGNKSCHILVQGQTDSRLCGASMCNVDFMPDDASSSCGVLLNNYPQSSATDRTFIFDKLCLKNINVLHPTKKGLFWFAFRGAAVQYRYFKVGSIRFDNVNLTIQLTNSNPNADLTTMDAKQVVYEAVS